jgi:hypothetical protein
MIYNLKHSLATQFSKSYEEENRNLSGILMAVATTSGRYGRDLEDITRRTKTAEELLKQLWILSLI